MNSRVTQETAAKKFQLTSKFDLKIFTFKKRKHSTTAVMVRRSKTDRKNKSKVVQSKTYRRLKNGSMVNICVAPIPCFEFHHSQIDNILEAYNRKRQARRGKSYWHEHITALSTPWDELCYTY